MRATLFFYPIIIGTVSIFKKAGNALRTLLPVFYRLYYIPNDKGVIDV